MIASPLCRRAPYTNASQTVCSIHALVALTDSCGSTHSDIWTRCRSWLLIHLVAAAVLQQNLIFAAPHADACAQRDISCTHGRRGITCMHTRECTYTFQPGHWEPLLRRACWHSQRSSQIRTLRLCPFSQQKDSQWDHARSATTGACTAS